MLLERVTSEPVPGRPEKFSILLLCTGNSVHGVLTRIGERGHES